MIINLDENFSYGVTKAGNSKKLKKFKFAGGEVSIKIEDVGVGKVASIACRLISSDAIMELLMVTDAIKRQLIDTIYLYMPYLPYARQDRVMIPGEALSLKVFANLINSQGYKAVSVLDVHSDTAAALINNFYPMDKMPFIRHALAEMHSDQDFYLVSPDAGAYKKIYEVARELDYKRGITVCNKVRDVSTGNITGYEIGVQDFHGDNIVIIDDICDGGATFIELAKHLKNRNCGTISLIVTHGIFSKGEEVLKPYIDKIYCTNSFKDIESDYIKQYKL